MCCIAAILRQVHSRSGTGVNILLFLGTVILITCIGEGMARYKGVPRLFPESSFSRKIGRDLFNAEGQPSCNEECMRRGYNTLLTLNRIGVRDINHIREKPDGIRRIVILGDSMTQGVQVPLKQTSFRQLQKLLDEKSSERWEVISLAASGFGTLEEIIMLEERGLAYDPDVVILQIYVNNDICDNSIKALGVCQSTPFRPYALQRRNGTLKRTTGQPIRNTLRHISSLFVALEASFLKARYHIHGPIDPYIIARILDEKMMERRKGLPLDPYSLNHVPEEYQPPFVKEGWEITELLLTQLSEELRKKDIAFVAYEIPPVWEVAHPADQWAEYIAQLPLPLIRGYGSERLRKLFQILRGPYLPLLKTFDEHRYEVLPYWDYHLNPSGHRIVAEAVFAFLKESGLVAAK